jgi:CRISPR-associated protein (TIGR03984 family)
MTGAIDNTIKHQEKKPECKLLTLQNIADNLYECLQEQACEYNLQYLLAHADDGIVWGKFDQNYKLTTSDQVFTERKYNLASLRLSTLRQCRIFGKNAELMLWRIEENWQLDQSWQARVIRDVKCSSNDYIPESQMLWGTHAESEAGGFTVVADGAEGLRHAIPFKSIPFSSDRSKLIRPLRLNVRHYIDYGSDGVAKIYLSRLVDLTTA